MSAFRLELRKGLHALSQFLMTIDVNVDYLQSRCTPDTEKQEVVGDIKSAVGKAILELEALRQKERDWD